MVYRKLFCVLLTTTILGNASKSYTMEGEVNNDEVFSRGLVNRGFMNRESVRPPSDGGWPSDEFDSDSDSVAQPSGSGAQPPQLLQSLQIKYTNGAFIKVCDTLRPTTITLQQPQESCLSKNKKCLIAVAGAGTAAIIGGAIVVSLATLLKGERAVPPTNSLSTASAAPLPSTVLFDELTSPPATTSSQGVFNEWGYLEGELSKEYLQWNIQRFTGTAFKVNPLDLEATSLALQIDPNIARGMTPDNYRARVDRTLENEKKVREFIRLANIRTSGDLPLRSQVSALKAQVRHKDYPQVQAFIRTQQSKRVRRAVTWLKEAEKGKHEDNRQARRVYQKQQTKKHQR